MKNLDSAILREVEHSTQHLEVLATMSTAGRRESVVYSGPRIAHGRQELAFLIQQNVQQNLQG